MYLDELYDYKNRFMQDILTNEQIVQLINPDVPLADAGSLVYSQVFPYEYIPETVEHGRTYICTDVDIQRVPSKTFLSPVLYVWVFTHKSLLRLPEGGVRVDKLVHEITKALNGSRYYGLGELELYSAKRFAPMTDYQGKVMIFNAKDFNMTSPTGKPIPSNRKSDE